MSEHTSLSIAETAAYYHQLLLIHILERIQFGMTEGYPQPKGDGYARPPFFIFGSGIPRAFLEAVVSVERDRFGKAMDELLQRKLIDEYRPKPPWPFHDDLEFYVQADRTIRLVHSAEPPNLDPFSSDGGLAVTDELQANGHRVRAISRRKIEGHWKEHPYQTWHALDCGPFYAVNAAGLAYVDQRYKDAGKNRTLYSWGFRYCEIQQRAKADTEKTITQAAQAATMPCQVLYELAVAAYKHSLELMQAIRLGQQRPASEFVSHIVRLTVLCDAIKTEAPNSLRYWPTSPATTFVAWSLDSALEVIIRIAEVMVSTGYWARSQAAGAIKDEAGRLLCHGGHIPPDLLVSEIIPHPLFENWYRFFIEHIQKAIFPPPDKWAIWEMNRDLAALESKLRDELQRASRAQEASGVLPKLQLSDQVNSTDLLLDGPTKAAEYYAKLTQTKADRSNARQRLQKPPGEYWISHIAEVAFRSLSRRGPNKKGQSELAVEADDLSYCSSCKSQIPAGEPLWRNLRLCRRCMVEFSDHNERK